MGGRLVRCFSLSEIPRSKIIQSQFKIIFSNDPKAIMNENNSCDTGPSHTVTKLNDLLWSISATLKAQVITSEVLAAPEFEKIRNRLNDMAGELQSMQLSIVQLAHK